MKTYQNIYQNGQWTLPLEKLDSAQLVIMFGNREYAADKSVQADLAQHFPQAEIIGCTTAGEIQNRGVYDDSLCLTALSFDSSNVSVVSGVISDRNLTEFAQDLASQLDPNGLRAVFVLSDGHCVNGTELVDGLRQALPEGIAITGGLAGDATRFEETHVWHNQKIGPERIVLCGFYGKAIRFSHGCAGGWTPFGPLRTITHSEGNVLYTLDDKPALELYKTYLGKYSEELPASALLFPLMLDDEHEGSRIRTILDINTTDQSMTFAGDVPRGSTVRLMRSTASSLVEGAGLAAESAFMGVENISGDVLAILISCVGRRLLLKSGTDEELESVAQLAGRDWAITGFYSYGELSPVTQGSCSMLHNQTMTISALYEAIE